MSSCPCPWLLHLCYKLLSSKVGPRTVYVFVGGGLEGVKKLEDGALGWAAIQTPPGVTAQSLYPLAATEKEIGLPWEWAAILLWEFWTSAELMTERECVIDFSLFSATYKQAEASLAYLMGNFSVSALLYCSVVFFGTPWALCFLVTCSVRLDFFCHNPLLERQFYYQRWRWVFQAFYSLPVWSLQSHGTYCGVRSFLVPVCAHTDHFILRGWNPPR